MLKVKNMFFHSALLDLAGGSNSSFLGGGSIEKLKKLSNSPAFAGVSSLGGGVKKTCILFDVVFGRPSSWPLPKAPNLLHFTLHFTEVSALAGGRPKKEKSKTCLSGIVSFYRPCSATLC